MTILDTFYLLFKSDTTQLKSGAEEAKKTIKSLNDYLTGSAGTVVATEKVGNAFLGLTKNFAGFIAASAAAAIVITNLKSATDYGIKLSQTAKLLNVNIEELDAWGNAVQKTGGSASAFEASLKGLAEHLGTTPAIALKTLPKLADSFERIGRFRSLKYGKMLGLDEPTILLLQRGRREVQAVLDKQKELGVVTKKDQETFLSFRDSINDTEHATRSLFSVFALDAIPVLDTLLKAVTKVFGYLMRHKDLVYGALIAIGLAALTIVIPFLIANAAIIGTIAAVSALIAIFALLYEDIKYYIQGHDSLLGRLVDKYKEFYKFLQKIGDKIGSFFPSGSTGALVFGKSQIDTASNSPLAAHTGASIFSQRAGDKVSDVTIGDITINTQATDAPGISSAFGSELRKLLGPTNDHFADGVFS